MRLVYLVASWGVSPTSILCTVHALNGVNCVISFTNIAWLKCIIFYMIIVIDIYIYIYVFGLLIYLLI